MQTATLRAVQPGDFEQVLAINKEGQPGVSPLTPTELSLALESCLYFGVVELANRIAGYVITYRAENEYEGDEFGWFKQNFSNFLYIDQIAIAASARRLRLGSQIYDQLEQVAQAQGLTSLVCEVNLEPPNLVSLNFHAHHQFVEVGTMETPDGRRVSLRRKMITRG